MTFRASNVLPQEGYDNVRSRMYRLRARCVAQSALMAVDGYDADRLLALLDDLADGQQLLSETSGIQGIAQYAKDQENDQSYDVVAEFVALTNAVDAAVAGIISAIPTSNPGNYVALHSFTGSTLTPRTFTAAQMAATKTLIDAVISGIS